MSFKARPRKAFGESPQPKPPRHQHHKHQELHETNSGNNLWVAGPHPPEDNVLVVQPVGLIACDEELPAAQEQEMARACQEAAAARASDSQRADEKGRRRRQTSCRAAPEVLKCGNCGVLFGRQRRQGPAAGARAGCGSALCAKNVARAFGSRLF